MKTKQEIELWAQGFIDSSLEELEPGEQIDRAQLARQLRDFPDWYERPRCNGSGLSDPIYVDDENDIADIEAVAQEIERHAPREQ